MTDVIPGRPAAPTSLAARLDPALLAAQRRVRAQPLLYRLALGTRVLLAAGFIPTGMVKLLGCASPP